MLEASISQVALWAMSTLILILIAILGWMGKKIFNKLDSLDNSEKKQTVAIAEIKKDTHSTSETVKELKQSMSKASNEIVELKLKIANIESRVKIMENA